VTLPSKSRIESIDLLKGLVMVIMALDHTRDYFFQSSNLFDLTDPSSTTLPIYLTRWISHFCAPAFSFLAGISAYLVGKRKTKNELSVFLLTRGLWLVFIELTIITFAWYFDVQFRNFDMAVIWSLGISMIFLAAIIYLPANVILLFSCLLIGGHNLFDNVQANGNLWWSILHEFAVIKLSEAHQINVIYPIVPWIAVMALGYYFGGYYDQHIDAKRRNRLFNVIGVLAMLTFILIRWTNVYGDLLKWEQYETATQTVMSFLNLTKYPPSLLYLLVTLGGTFLFLANTENFRGKAVDVFTTFGRVPFFYYILHLYFIRTLALVVAGVTGHGWTLMIQTTFDPDLKDFGFDLWIVYFIWIGIIFMLYPLCKWFDNYKKNHREKWWLSYL